MVDYRIELVGMPVSDVDRALEFYGTTLGWPVDHDQTVERRGPLHPGDPARLGVLDRLRQGRQRHGARLAERAPGRGDSADEALADLRARGVEATGVDDQPWGRFVYFADPDGNTWSVQELPALEHDQTRPEGRRTWRGFPEPGVTP